MALLDHQYDYSDYMGNMVLDFAPLANLLFVSYVSLDSVCWALRCRCSTQMALLPLQLSTMLGPLGSLVSCHELHEPVPNILGRDCQNLLNIC